MAMPIEKLKKVIAIATRGATPGERENAKRIIQKYCSETGLKYDDVIAGRMRPPGSRTKSDVINDAIKNYGEYNIHHYRAAQQQTPPPSWTYAGAQQRRGYSAGRPMRTEADVVRDVERGREKVRQNKERLDAIRDRLRKQGII